MRHIKEFFVNSFFTYFAIELVENILEELIITEVSGLIIKFVSTFLFVSFSTGAKMAFKAVIKRITYKEGNDKVTKLKQFFSWLNRNKCTFGGIAVAALIGVTGTGIVDIDTLPALMLWGHNVTPFIYWGLVGVLTILVSWYYETKKQYEQRVADRKADKENAAIQKEAKKQIANDEKLANQTQAEQEKAKAKAELDAKIKAEKERLDAEHKAKVEAAKLALLKEKNTQIETKTE